MRAAAALRQRGGCASRPGRSGKSKRRKRERRKTRKRKKSSGGLLLVSLSKQQGQTKQQQQQGLYRYPQQYIHNNQLRYSRKRLVGRQLMMMQSRGRRRSSVSVSSVSCLLASSLHHSRSLINSR
jgi:hypothetical protein